MPGQLKEIPSQKQQAKHEDNSENQHFDKTHKILYSELAPKSGRNDKKPF